MQQKQQDQPKNTSVGGAGQKRRASADITGGHEDDGPQFAGADYFLQQQNSRYSPTHMGSPNGRSNEDLHLSQEGGRPAKDDAHMEESFCSNFVCCGVHLADLHALLQHYEDVHVKVQNVDGDGMPAGEDAEGEDDQELDVVGDSMPSSSNSVSRTVQETTGRQLKRADSAVSTQSFGSTAAADALLGVATTYQPYARPRTADPYGFPEGVPMGYQYGLPMMPPPQYYATLPGYYQQQQQQGQNQQMTGREPVSAFDTTTILRAVSPAMAPGYIGYPFYQFPPQFYPHQYVPQPPQPQPIPAGSASAPVPGQKGPKRPRSAANIRAVQAASTILRESLPAAIAEQDLLSILSNTLAPSAAAASASTASSSKDSMNADEGNPAAEALLAMDPKSNPSAAARNAAAILSMPRPPVDKSLERPYICPVPGCGKSYKNPNGLKYHALHGHDGTNENVERPYKCPYGDCGKRYKNPNGLKYHVNKNHADMLPKSAVMAKAAQAAQTGREEDDDSDAHDHADDDIDGGADD